MALIRRRGHRGISCLGDGENGREGSRRKMEMYLWRRELREARQEPPNPPWDIQTPRAWMLSFLAKLNTESCAFCWSAPRPVCADKEAVESARDNPRFVSGLRGERKKVFSAVNHMQIDGALCHMVISPRSGGAILAAQY